MVDEERIPYRITCGNIVGEIDAQKQRPVEIADDRRRGVEYVRQPLAAAIAYEDNAVTFTALPLVGIVQPKFAMDRVVVLGGADRFGRAILFDEKTKLALRTEQVEASIGNDQLAVHLERERIFRMHVVQSEAMLVGGNRSGHQKRREGMGVMMPSNSHRGEELLGRRLGLFAVHEPQTCRRDFIIVR